MSALTNSRKRRRLVDLCSLLSPASPPPSKKPKLPPRSYPPPAPLPRPIHGPQRILKAFGLGSSNSIPTTPPDWGISKARDAEMGNFLSRLCAVKKASRRPDERSREELGLEDYKQLVGVRGGHSKALPTRARPFPPGPSDLTIVTRKDEGPSEYYSHVVNRKVDDARRIVLESMQERAWMKKGPLYKELYEGASRRHDGKLSSLEFEVRLTEEKLSASRLASQLQEKKPEEDLTELFSPLTDEEEMIISDAMHGGNSHEVLVTHEASNIEITRGVLQCLSYGAWLNDEVINLYLELLKEREKREPKRFLKCHFFNTFFYKKLISGRNGYDFKAVRRWTSQRKLGYGLIECDKIFVPIHKDIHWCLAVINVKEESFQYLDSLGGMDTNVLKVLARYFMDEVKEKSDIQIYTSSWKQETVNDLPLQKNGWDCGMFMLKYADFYSRGLSLCFSQEHMAYFRKRTAMELLRLKAE